jgi:hypothetical protein
LALDNEEINDETTEDVRAREDVAVAEINGAGYEGCEEGEEEVPEPDVTESVNGIQ